MASKKQDGVQNGAKRTPWDNISQCILETLRVTKLWDKQIYLSGGRGPSFLPFYKLLTRLNLFISKYQICSFQLKLAQIDTLYNHLARKLSKWQFISQQAQINHCMLLYGNYVIDYSEWWRWSNVAQCCTSLGTEECFHSRRVCGVYLCNKHMCYSMLVSCLSTSTTLSQC